MTDAKFSRMANLSKLMHAKKITKILREHRYQFVAALLVAGGAAVLLGRNGNLRRLKAAVMKGVTSMRGALAPHVERAEASAPY